LAAKQLNQEQVLAEIEDARRQRLEKTEKLRALRLEQEAADKKEADKAAAEKAKGKKTSGDPKPVRLPQPHRQQF